MSAQKPELEVQRTMLTQMRDNFRAQGFEVELNLAAIRVQSAEGVESEREKLVQELETKARNCYRSAEELQSMLAKLPNPKKEKKA